MNFKGVLIAVRDMEKSVEFYRKLFGFIVVGEFGANVQLSDGLFLQTADTWKDFVHKTAEEIVCRNNASELYFELKDMDAFVKKLEEFKDVEYLHPLYENSWGQRGIRFYDPDGHVIEVAEEITMVMKRFMDSGLSAEETAARMDIPLGYVLGCLGGLY